MNIPSIIQKELDKQGIKKLRPAQDKAIRAGLFKGNNVLVCTPTASGKTLVAEMAILYTVLLQQKKGIYVVPLRALATEKYKEFSKKYPQCKVTVTSGDMDSDDRYLAEYDIIITTSEKLDSLLRHHAPWLEMIGVLVVDEIHLLNDVGRGPTLEILITIMRDQLPKLQLIGLSATIGNAYELAQWLGAQLVEDSWRPVKLHKGIFHEDTIYFQEEITRS